MNYDISTTYGFEQMYQEYYNKLYNYIFYQILSREDTEDIVSSVFLKVARNAGSFDPEKSSLSTWLYRIAKNTLIDYYRVRKIHYSLDDDNDLVLPSIDFEEQLENIASPKRKAIFSALTELKPIDRLIVFYRYFEGYNNREIAKLLHLNESTVGSRLSRALVKLRTEELSEFK